MKKLFTVLFSAAVITSASAQKHIDTKVVTQNRYGNFDKSERNDKFDRNQYTNELKQRDAQIQQINHDFDRKVMAEKSNRKLPRNEKNNRITRLDKKRDQQTRFVMDKFAKSTYAYNGNHSSGSGTKVSFAKAVSERGQPF